MARMFLLKSLLEEAHALDNLEKRQQSARIRSLSLLTRDDDYVSIYRLSKELIESDLLPLIKPTKRRGKGLTTRVKILCTLSFLASGSYQKVIKEGIRTYLSQPSASRCINEVVEALNNPAVVKKYIRFPQNQQERQIGAVSIFFRRMMLLLVCVAVLVIVVVFYLQKAHSTFKEKGVKYLKTVPILTDLCSMLMPSEHLGETIKSLYNSYPEERFVGKYDFLKESVVIRDIELLKKITIKDFEHFVDHSSPGPDDSLFGRSLFFLKGHEWKDMRTSLSPAFTSSKIRQMVPFMMEVGEQMILSLKKKLKNSGGDYIDVECKDLTTRFANDVIASCAFGLKVDSHADEDNEFYKMGKAVSSFKFSQILFFILLSSLPFVNKLIAVDVVPKPAQDFFRRLVLDAMKEREQKNIFRPDMIHLLMEAKKGKLSHEEAKTNDEAAGFATVEESTVGRKQLMRVWKDDDLVSQAFLFFAAGFESVSSSMSFLLYELALNPDVQERLAQEIRDHDAKSGGKFDFSSIQSLKYMDMVISELLRRWPPFVVLDRQCTKDYNLGKPNPDSEKDYILRDGADILIPVYGIHLNPEYFPNPEKFDPERFSDENKHNIKPFTYMPFGNGPRNCLGSRFALCEMKVITYQLIRHMVLSPCEKTSIPAKLSPDQFNLRLEGGHWLRFRLRD